MYRVVGKGTREFAALTAGKVVDMIGPLGNGFTLKDKRAGSDSTRHLLFQRKLCFHMILKSILLNSTKHWCRSTGINDITPDR